MNKTSHTNKLSSGYDIVVFSHLRWEFVIQRPQHIINRLAKDRTVLFVEEPIGYTPKNNGKAHVINGGKNITVIQPQIAWENMIEEGTPIVNLYMEKLGIENPILWFYAPMYADMIDTIDHSLIVYDCMDELSAFKNAPPQLITNEKYLISRADVIFTGGKSLYDAKKQLHDNVHCFPSSVDRNHFEKVFKRSTIIPSEIAALPKPVVGFYGVIDERIDLALLHQIAQAMPKVSFVMIGPVVKIDEAELPRDPNIYYLGGRSYDQLPQYLKGIDIAMMPFAINKHTQFISPTKTLEFMAALKPIISTPIYDVVRDYKKEVAIVSSADEFVKAIKKYSKETVLQKQRRTALQKAVIDLRSWDNTVAAMKDAMTEALQKSPALIEESSLQLQPAYELNYSL